MGLILSIIPERPVIRVVDVGAMDIGTMLVEGEGASPYAKLEQAGMVNIVGFEPVQEECDNLNATAGASRKYLPYAVGDGRMRTFYICNYSMTSSLYEPNTALLTKFQNLEELTRVVKTVPIQTHRMDDIPEVAHTDLLKLDVQGAELDVLKGAEKVLTDVVLVHTEVEFVEMYKGQAMFADVDQYLRGQGFAFHTFAGAAGRAFKPLVVGGDVNRWQRQYLWANAVYVKDYMKLESLPAEKLLKLAVILDVEYDSVDLALEVLRVYDLKAKTGLADQYLRGLIRK
jgi:FkbM family methyltransferase